MKRPREMQARLMRRRTRREVEKRRTRPARMLCSRFSGGRYPEPRGMGGLLGMFGGPR